MANRPTTSDNFSEIEKFLNSLTAVPKSTTTPTNKNVQSSRNSSYETRSKSNDKPKPGRRTSQDNQPTIGQQWNNLLVSDSVTDNEESMQRKEPSRKKRKGKHANSGSNKKAKSTSGGTNRKSAPPNRKASTTQKKALPEDTASIPDTTSDDDETKGFFEQLKKLAEQKKKVGPSMNPTTITDTT